MLVCVCACAPCFPSPSPSVVERCMSELVCFLNKCFWIESYSYILSMPRWPTHPGSPGTFPGQTLESPPSWEPPSVLEKLGRLVTPAFMDKHKLFFVLCFLISYNLENVYTILTMSRFNVNTSCFRIIFGFIEKKKIQCNLMMKEAGHFYGSSFIWSCTTTLLCCQEHCSSCSSTSARGRRFYRHLNR